jgi:oligopeptide/dipeptide ABC transporter ATP-binding protein
VSIVTEPLLAVKDLKKYFPVRSGISNPLRAGGGLQIRAVDGVSFTVGKKESLGLVGESGSGKTTLGRAVLMLEEPTSGHILFNSLDITSLRGEHLRQLRKKMQVVFQNPNSSLDPRQRMKDIISEPLRAFKGSLTKSTEETVVEVAAAVGLPEDGLMRFPHEFSGGQRQRIAIARALVLNPELIVLDEPTSALDASVQAQILNLLRRIQEQFGLSYLFITHNVNVVKYMADTIAVMYAGKLVEIGSTRKVLEQPLHHYTIALISSVPDPDPERPLKSVPLKGEVPSPLTPPSGCRFHPRCEHALAVCRTTEPQLRQIRGRLVACHRDS